MKKFWILFLLSLASIENTFALTYEIIGPCKETPERTGSSGQANLNVGRATLEILKQNSIPYVGTEDGIQSILNTPIGPQSLEIISGSEMRAYGWCYEVDGKQPDVMPNEFHLNGNEHLKWFYAFSHYKNGEWTGYCVPAYTVRPANLCH